MQISVWPLISLGSVAIFEQNQMKTLYESLLGNNHAGYESLLGEHARHLISLLKHNGYSFVCDSEGHTGEKGVRIVVTPKNGTGKAIFDFEHPKENEFYYEIEDKNGRKLLTNESATMGSLLRDEALLLYFEPITYISKLIDKAPGSKMKKISKTHHYEEMLRKLK